MTERPQVTQPRDTLLLSHANPEDNEFTLWLALQLAKEGYRVWCDLTKLLGGEIFWDDIEDVIRQSAVKVLFVLSRTSNARDGALRVKGGVKLDHWSGGKVDQSPGGGGLGLKDLRGRLERRPATRLAGRV